MMTTTITRRIAGLRAFSRVDRRSALAVILFALLLTVGCGSPSGHQQSEGNGGHDHAASGKHGHDDEHDHASSDRVDVWSITAWGERFEVFPEIEAPRAGVESTVHLHVTRLAGFEPLTEGSVEVVLAGAGGEEVARADRPERPGVFNLGIRPSTTGEADLVFRIYDEVGVEEIRGGRLRIGTDQEPGALVRAPAPRGGSDSAESATLSKEQQWRRDFGTAWVRTSPFAESISGLATVRPPAGGTRVVTASVGGVVQPVGGTRSWPFVGRRIDRGSALVSIVPLVAVEASLPALEADLAGLEAELAAAQARLERLNTLLSLEAVSERDVDDARVRVRSLESRRSAAARDLATARTARQVGSGGVAGGGTGHVLRAPFAGEVAAVMTTPGATVTAGDALFRLVRTDAVWIELALAPSDAGRLSGGAGLRGLVLDDPETGPLRIDDGLSLVSVAPEISASNGFVSVLVEIAADADGSSPLARRLPLGSTTPAQLLLREQHEGIVIPSAALVDDGGISVVYLQLAGEAFVRQEVRVVSRQGEIALVEGLVAGQRLVTRGGEAIRRLSLMAAAGDSHGHAH